MITVNIDKCKDIWKDKWREARKPLLEQLDVEYIKALENNDTSKQQEIVFKKQELRNITKLELPNNIEEIKNVWPEVLK